MITKQIHTVYGQRYNESDIILDHRTKEVIDDGLPKKIKLSEWSDLKTAESFAEHVKNNTKARAWRIWVESL